MSDSNRTEQPTQRRRNEARRRGQVARSRDLNDAFQLGAALMVLTYWGPSMVAGLGRVMALGMTVLFAAMHLKAMRNEILRRRVKALRLAQVQMAGGVARQAAE